ncbi:hypothetical protein RA263_27555, partial [Pseudomonas syringae pv. tagetis]
MSLLLGWWGVFFVVVGGGLLLYLLFWGCGGLACGWLGLLCCCVIWCGVFGVVWLGVGVGFLVVGGVVVVCGWGGVGVWGVVGWDVGCLRGGVVGSG